MRLKLVGIAVGILLLALVILRLVVPGSGTPGQAVLPTNENAKMAPGAIGPASVCNIQITSPTADTPIPGYGPVKVEWTGGGGTAVGDSSAYTVDVYTPLGSNSGWGYSPQSGSGQSVFPEEKHTNDTSTNLYMENYQPGDFTVEVTGSSLDGTVHCSAHVDFTRPPWSLDNLRRQKGNDSGGAAPLTGIVVNPQGP